MPDYEARLIRLSFGEGLPRMESEMATKDNDIGFRTVSRGGMVDDLRGGGVALSLAFDTALDNWRPESLAGNGLGRRGCSLVWMAGGSSEQRSGQVNRGPES